MCYEDNIGKAVHKHKSGKPFKSGNQINVVKGVIMTYLLTPLRKMTAMLNAVGVQWSIDLLHNK